MSDLHISCLPNRGAVSVSGTDARSFLQGVITNDIEKLADNSALYSAFLTPQGKFLHDFFVVTQGDVLLLDCEGDRAADLAGRLARYRLRAAVDISVVDPAPVVAVAFGGNPAVAFSLPDQPGATRHHAGTIVYADPRLPDLGVRIITPTPSDLDEFVNAVPHVPAAPEAYDRWRLQRGVPDGSRDFQVEKSTLLEGNADHLNGVDWQKGCYLGQELTARVHYRGLLKRRLVPFTVSGAKPAVGTPVMLDDKQIGITRSAVDGTTLALVEIAALDKPGAFSAGAAELQVIRPAWADS